MKAPYLTIHGVDVTTVPTDSGKRVIFALELPVASAHAAAQFIKQGAKRLAALQRQFTSPQPDFAPISLKASKTSELEPTPSQ